VISTHCSVVNGIYCHPWNTGNIGRGSTLHPGIDREAAVYRFAGMIPFRTVSDRGGFDLRPFLELHGYITDTWPDLHDRCSWQTVAGGSLLITFHGTDAGLEPVLLAAHLDVVPVEDAESPLWEHPPWSGHVAGNRIWGRGTLDFKSGAAAILESCQLLIQSGFTPARTIIIALGHDEEVGGNAGARAITDTLRGRGIERCSFVIDEGGYVYSFPWLTRDVAVIGLAEKGYATIEVSASGTQGHASRPAGRTPVGLVSEAVGLLERQSTPVRLCGPVLEMIRLTRRCFVPGSPAEGGDEALAGYMERWPEGNALVRTTLAPTVTRGSQRENVIPARASTLVNYRIIPGETVEDTLASVRLALDGLDVQVDVPDRDSLAEPSGVSPTDTDHWNAVATSLSRLCPDAVVAPGIFPASTDSKHYRSLSDSVYRIFPARLGEAGMAALHCEGESIGVDDYVRCVRFYTDVLERTCG